MLSTVQVSPAQVDWVPGVSMSGGGCIACMKPQHLRWHWHSLPLLCYTLLQEANEAWMKTYENNENTSVLFWTTCSRLQKRSHPSVDRGQLHQPRHFPSCQVSRLPRLHTCHCTLRNQVQCSTHCCSHCTSFNYPCTKAGITPQSRATLHRNSLERAEEFERALKQPLFESFQNPIAPKVLKCFLCACVNWKQLQ